MSQVLWANTLIGGVVSSDESDKYALYKHVKKLSKLSQKIGVLDFLSMQDTTDAEFNISNRDLPEGMRSTNELMARDGVWVSGEDAVKTIEGLIEHISQNDIKFGVFSNDASAVINELQESLVLAQKAEKLQSKFNFCVVM